MLIFRKINNYGYRRAVIRVFLIFIQKIRVYVYKLFFSDNGAILKGVKLNQPAQFVGRGSIELHGVTVGLWPSPGFISGSAYFEARGKTASIRVGNGTVFNNGAVIIADKGVVSIGLRCLIGPCFFVVDSDFHGLEIENRNNSNYECEDVFIGNDVFIGSNVKIMKGVRVGDGSIIGTGSVVVSDVEALSIYAGVPARLIRKI